MEPEEAFSNAMAHITKLESLMTPKMREDVANVLELGANLPGASDEAETEGTILEQAMNNLDELMKSEMNEDDRSKDDTFRSETAEQSNNLDYDASELLEDDREMKMRKLKRIQHGEHA
jgi:hypothetical protein